MHEFGKRLQKKNKKFFITAQRFGKGTVKKNNPDQTEPKRFIATEDTEGTEI
jgi:hypothetical protein